MLILQMIELLVHVATPCHSAQCQYQRCRWMKTVIRHIMNCKMACEDCTKCRQFWTLIRMHSLSCRDSQCTVPKCRYIKSFNTYNKTTLVNIIIANSFSFCRTEISKQLLGDGSSSQKNGVELL